MPTCKGLRRELIDCLLISDCVVVEKKSAKECLQGDSDRISRYGPGGDGVPEKCRQIQRAHQICVRGLVSVHFRKVFTDE
jgi:cytochrome c oxidase assembly factor 5